MPIGIDPHTEYQNSFYHGLVQAAIFRDLASQEKTCDVMVGVLMKRTLMSSLLLSFSVLTIAGSAVFAQGGPPLPGNNYTAPSGAPVPNAVPQAAPTQAPTAAAAPLPGPPPQQVLSGNAGNYGYRRLPLTYQNAAIRLEELRNIMISAKPKDFQDAITDYLDWLADMADGHWKIYQAFAKVESMKAQADLEKQSTLKLGSLKRQAMLLKAEFLIRNNRQPEALQPLIDIVAAEPRTATGEAAYSLLKQIGFSEELPLNTPSASEPGPSGAAISQAKPIAANPAQSAPSNSALASKEQIAAKKTVLSR